MVISVGDQEALKKTLLEYLDNPDVAKIRSWVTGILLESFTVNVVQLDSPADVFMRYGVPAEKVGLMYGVIG